MDQPLALDRRRTSSDGGCFFFYGPVTDSLVVAQTKFVSHTCRLPVCLLLFFLLLFPPPPGVREPHAAPREIFLVPKRFQSGARRKTRTTTAPSPRPRLLPHAIPDFLP